MPNYSFYTMNAVSKSKESLERLIRIMNENDNEYYIYRVFSAEKEEEWQEDGYYAIKITGDVAWSTRDWFDNTEQKWKTLDNGSHYVTLDILCKRLGIAVELYEEEPGCEFQAYITCDHNGIVSRNVVDYEEQWEDDDGNELDEPIIIGGFGDDYCTFSKASEIYGDDSTVEVEAVNKA